MLYLPTPYSRTVFLRRRCDLSFWMPRAPLLSSIILSHLKLSSSWSADLEHSGILFSLQEIEGFFILDATQAQAQNCINVMPHTHLSLDSIVLPGSQITVALDEHVSSDKGLALLLGRWYSPILHGYCLSEKLKRESQAQFSRDGAWDVK